jgi:hypothetical protein
LSTGPKSDSGKAKSSQNALKHGFFAKAILLPSEDLGVYEAHRDALWSDLDPQNTLEALWAKEIVDTHWRLQRLGLIEIEVFTRRSISFTGDQCGVGFAFINDAQGLSTFAKLSQYEAILTRRLHRAMEEFWKLRQKGLRESSTAPTEPEASEESSRVQNNAEVSPDPACEQEITENSDMLSARNAHTTTTDEPAYMADPANVTKVSKSSALEQRAGATTEAFRAESEAT